MFQQDYFATIRRDEEGCYEAPLPWRQGRARPPTNRAIADRRLQSLLVRLRRDRQALSDYHYQISSYFQDGYIARVDPSHEGKHTRTSLIGQSFVRKLLQPSAVLSSTGQRILRVPQA